jgi:hypothetical protein
VLGIAVLPLLFPHLWERGLAQPGFVALCAALRVAPLLLTAASVGSVLMGATTYIGNEPQPDGARHRRALRLCHAQLLLALALFALLGAATSALLHTGAALALLCRSGARAAFRPARSP